MADTLESLEIEVVHSATGAAEEINSVAKAVRSLSKALEKAIPSLTIFQRTLGKNTFNITDNSSRTTQIGETINNIKEASSGAKSATTEAAKGVKTLAKEASKAKSPLENFVSSLKRIAFYRIIRSIIKSITQAFSEGLQNAYAFSQGITTEGSRFATALDSMSSAGQKMKNQLGSAFISLLAAIAPIVNAIISLVTALANALSQLFAVFTGGSYLKANDVSKQFADNMKSGAGAAKEWKNQLLGFDEINRLNEPSGGGGGGGASVLDPMSMFEDTPIDGIFKKMKQKLDELKESLDFSKLKESWDRLKKSVQELGDAILSALGWVWENILVPLAHWTIEEAAPAAINLLASAFEFLNAVLQNLAPVFQWVWDNILKPIAEWTGETFIKALQTITSLLEKLTKLLNGDTSFKDFINTLSPAEEILLAIATAVATVYTALGIYNAVSALSALATGGLSAALAFLAANPIVLVIAGIAALILIGIELYKHWDDIKKKANELGDAMVRNFNNGKLEWTDFLMIGFHAINGIIGGISTLISWISTLIGWIRSAVSWWNGLGSITGNGGGTFLAGYKPQKYASGGYPDGGQLFIANEAGPEMVGTMNGRTAVATNNDIVEGIRQGVFEAVSAAMLNQNSEDRPIKVYLDSREIKTGIQRLNRAMGV